MFVEEIKVGGNRKKLRYEYCESLCRFLIIIFLNIDKKICFVIKYHFFSEVNDNKLRQFLGFERKCATGRTISGLIIRLLSDVWFVDHNHNHIQLFDKQKNWSNWIFIFERNYYVELKTHLLGRIRID